MEAPAERPPAAAAPSRPPPTTLLSYDVAVLDAFAVRHFATAAVVGFDAEWRPCRARGEPPHPVALLQLATPRAVLLVPVAHLPSRALPPAVLRLLEDASVLKVGVGAAEDARKLRRDLGALVAGVVDAGLAATRNGGAETYPRPGLAGLWAALFGEALHKPKHVSCSNWEARPLSAAQARYAAQDAHASLAIASGLHRRHGRGEALADWLRAHGGAGGGGGGGGALAAGGHKRQAAAAAAAAARLVFRPAAPLPLPPPPPPRTPAAQHPLLPAPARVVTRVPPDDGGGGCAACDEPAVAGAAGAAGRTARRREQRRKPRAPAPSDARPLI